MWPRRRESAQRCASLSGPSLLPAGLSQPLRPAVLVYWLSALREMAQLRARHSSQGRVHRARDAQGFSHIYTFRCTQTTGRGLFPNKHCDFQHAAQTQQLCFLKLEVSYGVRTSVASRMHRPLADPQQLPKPQCRACFSSFIQNCHKLGYPSGFEV